MTRDVFTVGNHEGYVARRDGRPARIVIQIGDVDYSMTLDDARGLCTLLLLLLREAGMQPSVWAAVLVHNVATAGALCAAFRAGDNFGFHMGSDESQCTCQWRPNAHGEAHPGRTRCEQDEVYEQDEHNKYDSHGDSGECPHCEFGCSSCSPLVGGEG